MKHFPARGVVEDAHVVIEPHPTRKWQAIINGKLSPQGLTDYANVTRPLKQAGIERMLYVHTPVYSLDPFYVGEAMTLTRPFGAGNRHSRAKDERESRWWTALRRLPAPEYKVRIIASVPCSDLRMLLEAALIRLHQPDANRLKSLRVKPNEDDLAWALNHPLLEPWLWEWMGKDDRKRNRLEELTTNGSFMFTISLRRPHYVCCDGDPEPTWRT